jgi:hypothetical protein
MAWDIPAAGCIQSHALPQAEANAMIEVWTLSRLSPPIQS